MSKKQVEKTVLTILLLLVALDITKHVFLRNRHVETEETVNA
jgi:hypothetical protein